MGTVCPLTTSALSSSRSCDLPVNAFRTLSTPPADHRGGIPGDYLVAVHAQRFFEGGLDSIAHLFLRAESITSMVRTEISVPAGCGSLGRELVDGFGGPLTVSAESNLSDTMSARLYLCTEEPTWKLISLSAPPMNLPLIRLPFFTWFYLDIFPVSCLGARSTWSGRVDRFTVTATLCARL